MGHTPGPWSIREVIMGKRRPTAEQFIYGSNRIGIARMMGTGQPTMENARLIAAAPELLEALEGVNRYLDSPDTSKRAEYLYRTRKAIWDAIARAEGELRK
jgi:hypothetical protein